jgi:ketosteroid isomerase-like protein
MADGADSDAVDAPPDAEQVRARLWVAYDQAWDAWHRGDIETLLALWGPHIVLDLTNVAAWPEADIYRGEEGARRFAEDWLAAWQDLQIETKDLAVEGERVLAHFQMNARGRGSGVRVTLDLWQIAEMREGRLQRMDHYDDRAAAMAAFES